MLQLIEQYKALISNGLTPYLIKLGINEESGLFNGSVFHLLSIESYLYIGALLLFLALPLFFLAKIRASPVLRTISIVVSLSLIVLATIATFLPELLDSNLPSWRGALGYSSLVLALLFLGAALLQLIRSCSYVILWGAVAFVFSGQIFTAQKTARQDLRQDLAKFQLGVPNQAQTSARKEGKTENQEISLSDWIERELK